MAGETILIVDDNPINLKLARLTLSAEGFRVESASDAEQALASLQSSRPALILMDIQLPGMDGLELTRRIKECPETRKIVVVAVTAYAMKGDEQLAIASGCDGYLAKPIDTRTLGATVAKYLGERR